MKKYDEFKGGKGFPDLLARSIAKCPVRGIDIEQVHNMILHCRQTSAFLYGAPAKSFYRRGSRPVLEHIVASVVPRRCGEREKLQALVAWVEDNVVHANGRKGKIPPDRAMTEEMIIKSGWGWCNEQARVLVCLAQVAGLAGRMCFLGVADEGWGHTTAEIFVQGKWVFADPTYGILLAGPGGVPASAKDIQQETRPAIKKCFGAQYRLAQVREIVRWKKGNPSLNVERELGHIHDARLFSCFALCNYAI